MDVYFMFWVVLVLTYLLFDFCLLMAYWVCLCVCVCVCFVYLFVGWFVRLYG